MIPFRTTLAYIYAGEVLLISLRDRNIRIRFRYSVMNKVRSAKFDRLRIGSIRDGSIN